MIEIGNWFILNGVSVMRIQDIPYFGEDFEEGTKSKVAVDLQGNLYPITIDDLRRNPTPGPVFPRFK